MNDHDVSRLLALAERAATRAGRLLSGLSGRSSSMPSEAGRDIKLDADRRAEADILQALASSGLPVLAEEAGEVGIIDVDCAYWVVDPLDGTYNFFRGIRPCGLSIGLWQGGAPVLGVVHDFAGDECFSGAVGLGARLNGTPIRVSDRTDAAAAVLATGCPVHQDYGDEAVSRLVRQMQRFKKVRMFGSAALSAAYVSCGRIDAYGEDGIMLWDVAAGAALVAAAGGWIDVQPSPGRPWATTTRLASCAQLWKV